MSTTYHTAITTGAAANATTLNAPLAQLDAALITVAAQAQAVTNTVLLSGAAVTQANGAANAGQKVVTVDDASIFVAGCVVEYTLAGGTLETNTVDTVDNGTQITLTANIGTGGIPDNGPVAVVPKGFYNAKVGTYNVHDYGALGDDATDDTTALQAAINAAHTGRGVVFLPKGTYKVTGGLTLNGKSCGIVGQGPDSIIKAYSQTGPVLDMSAFGSSNWKGSRIFRDFTIEGDGAADATLTHSGIKIAQVGSASVYNTIFENIAISNTGGPCWDFYSETFFNMLVHCICQRPVGAATNDVPYIRLRGNSSCNTFIGLILRSDGTADDGTAVVQCVADGTATPNNNTFLHPKSEYMHTPEDGAHFDILGIGNVIEDYVPADQQGTVGATNSCLVRLRALAVGAYGSVGGNIVRGWAAGGIGATISDVWDGPNYGVIIEGDANTVDAIVGGTGRHIAKLASGAEYNTVIVKGVTPFNTGNTGHYIVDASGNTTNAQVVYVDNSFVVPGLQMTVGTLRQAVRSITATRILDATDYIVNVDATADHVYVTLPAAASHSGREYIIKKTDATANQVVMGSAVDGDAGMSLALTAQYQVWHIYSDGSVWRWLHKGAP